MEEEKINGQICSQQLDVPDLIRHIQSLLTLDEAVRTCVLSKSWLHAWSTIPNLRFRQCAYPLSNGNKRKYISLICRTLGRFHRDNIPITSFDLEFSIQDKKSHSLVDKWVQKVAYKTNCLKDLYLKLIFLKSTSSFTLTDEIFSCENLGTIIIMTSVEKYSYNDVTSLLLMYRELNSHPLVIIGSNPVINCVNLRVLSLCRVYISEEVLHNLLTTCRLLEMIDLSFLKKGGSNMKIKVQNLAHLHNLKITFMGKQKNDILEIHDLPSLRSLFC
ncbi:F-box/FBD/LRR-repeat protein At1g13570-like [Rutidosis leptorrhynchoides]|uniref:F-box/FBD/LRR-repeat protein At1g13570-like n=1 Tax=Rutidosis leptorrhynchoides TaxID=125765 RepID=UPI003A99F655